MNVSKYLKTTVAATALSTIASMGVLKSDLSKQGVSWQDVPIAGGGGSDAMTVLRARVVAGDAPTAAQMLGFDIKDWAGSTGNLANLNDVAEAESWDSVVSTASRH